LPLILLARANARFAVRAAADKAAREAKERKKAAQIAARAAAGPRPMEIHSDAEAKAAIARILIAHPQLSDFGYGGVYGAETLDREEYARQLKANRAKLLEPLSLARFPAAVAWLSAFPKIGALNRRGTSYGLKHVAARHISGVPGYVTNGVFICAAIAAGFNRVIIMQKGRVVETGPAAAAALAGSRSRSGTCAQRTEPRSNKSRRRI
jgi:hypothetical protein